jgi:hypothetical protein
MRLSEFKWEGIGTLEELILWGLDPMKMMLDYMDMVIEDEMEPVKERADAKMLGIRNELLDKVNDMEEAMYRFITEARAFEKSKELEKKDNEKIEGGV